MLLFKVLWRVKTNPKCHILIQRDSKCTRWGLPSSASFHDKEPVPHITNGFCWTGLGGNTGSMSAECSPKSSWLLVCQGLSDSSISDQLLRWYHGGSDVHAAYGTCWFAGQSESLEMSWESPRLCRWEIMDGMLWLLSCETRLFCSNGVECSLRTDPCRSCLVILPGGIYS